jgi:hypothetical protein
VAIGIVPSSICPCPSPHKISVRQTFASLLGLLTASALAAPPPLTGGGDYYFDVPQTQCVASTPEGVAACVLEVTCGRRGLDTAFTCDPSYEWAQNVLGCTVPETANCFPYFFRPFVGMIYLRHNYAGPVCSTGYTDAGVCMNPPGTSPSPPPTPVPPSPTPSPTPVPPPTGCTTPTGEQNSLPAPPLSPWGAAPGYETTALWLVTLLPDTEVFSGRTVTEVFPLNSGGPDTCHFKGSKFDPLINHTSSSWRILADNRFDSWDVVGWPSDWVDYYRQMGRAPCSSELQQHMYINCPDGTQKQYSINTLRYGITQTDVLSQRGNSAPATRKW